MKIYLVSDNVDTLWACAWPELRAASFTKQGELKKAIDHALEDKEIGIPAADGKVRKRVSRIDQ